MTSVHFHVYAANRTAEVAGADVRHTRGDRNGVGGAVCVSDVAPFDPESVPGRALLSEIGW